MEYKPITITLRLPPRELSPNSRAGWRAKAEAVKDYRTLAWAEATALGRQPRWERATQQTTYYFANNRRRDGDNHLAQLKPVWDGLAEAGVVADDSGITHRPVKMKIDSRNPRVEIEIWGTV